MDLGQNAKTQIYNVLKERIIYLDYNPGQVLNEKELCLEFRTSRTPIREAILKLQDQRLVRIIPRSGTFVEEIHLLELKDLFVVKQTLEGLAAELAAGKATNYSLEVLEEILKKIHLARKNRDLRMLTELDQEFHKNVHSLSFNKPLEEMLESINARCARGWYFFSKTISNEVLDSSTNLEDIYLSLKEQDKEKSRQATEKHVSDFLEKIKQILV